MKITIISIGKFENSPHRSIFEHYKKRMKWSVELKELELKNINNLSTLQIKEEEGKLILKAIKPNSMVIALDEKAKQFNSKDFAKLLSDAALNGDSNINFIIGGANGLAEEILKKSPIKMSFGLLTLPHLMVRTILMEQIYRAQTIINQHPYHKE